MMVMILMMMVVIMVVMMIMIKVMTTMTIMVLMTVMNVRTRTCSSWRGKPHVRNIKILSPHYLRHKSFGPSSNLPRNDHRDMKTFHSIEEIMKSQIDGQVNENIPLYLILWIWNRIGPPEIEEELYRALMLKAQTRFIEQKLALNNLSRKAIKEQTRLVS